MEALQWDEDLDKEVVQFLVEDAWDYVYGCDCSQYNPFWLFGAEHYEAVTGQFRSVAESLEERKKEMREERWADVDFEDGDLVIDKSRSVAKNRDKTMEDKKYVTVEGTTKNEKARRIKLKHEALEVLRELRNDDIAAGMEELIVRTRTGKGNTATNLEHRMATIFKNAGLVDLNGGLHIFRRTFATNMYEKGARVKEIAAYIGDLESTTERYYIAVRKKVKEGDKAKQVVMLPVEEKREHEGVE